MRKFVGLCLVVVILAASLASPCLPFLHTIPVVFAATAPDITDNAVDNITYTGMNLNGMVLDTGGENPHVYICWTQQGKSEGSYSRPEDFLEAVFEWEYVVDMGHLGYGTFTTHIDDLQPTGVHWCVYAQNSAGDDGDTGTVTTPTYSDGLQDSFETDNYSIGLSTPGWWRLAQAWRPTDNYDVASISYEITTKRGNYTCALYNCNTTDNTPMGAALASTTLPYASVASDSWNRFYFTTPVAVLDNTTYSIQMYTDDASGNPVYWRGNDRPSVYENGTVFKSEDGGATWINQNKDANFRVYTIDGRRTVVDTEYPTRAELGETWAIVSGGLDILYSLTCNVTFQYGTDNTYGSETAIQVFNAADSTISDNISPLVAGTEYHYRIKSVDINGTSYGDDVKFVTLDWSEEGVEVMSGAGVGDSYLSGQLNYQRRSFYAQGLYWVFYDVGDDIYYKTSADGVTWSAAVDCWDNYTVDSDCGFCISYSPLDLRMDIVTAYRAVGIEASPLDYRAATVCDNGSLLWLAGVQHIMSTPALAANELWTTPFITCDVNGYPWVVAGICGGISYFSQVSVCASSTKNGTWTTKVGFPTPSYPTVAGAVLGGLTDDDVRTHQRAVLVALEDGSMIVIGGRRSEKFAFAENYDGASKLRYNLWNSDNSAWTTPDYCTTSTVQWTGDGNYACRTPWQAVAIGNTAYLVLTDSGNDIKAVTFTKAGGWSAETAIINDVKGRTTPQLTAAQDGVYCIWASSPIETNLYYSKYTLTTATWSAPVVFASDACLDNRANVQTWADTAEGHCGVVYRASDSSEITYLGWPNALQIVEIHYSLKFVYLGTGFAVSTKAASDIYGDAATLNAMLVDDNGTVDSIRFQYGTTTAFGLTTGWVGGYTTSDNAQQLIALLSVSTTYYFRAQATNPAGVIVNGCIRSFTTTTGVPVVTTSAAINVGVVSSTLRGYLNYDTGLGCQYRFQYGLTAVYTDNTVWSTDNINSGESFSGLITGLAASTTYHFRAQCMNTYGIGSGGDLTFVTYASAGVPIDLMAIPVSSTEIALSWIKGSGGPQTVIRWKAGSYPINFGQGTLVYKGYDSSYLMENCTAGTTYFFSAWGFDEPAYYSASYATAVATTPAGSPVDSGSSTDNGTAAPDSTSLDDSMLGDLLDFVSTYGELPSGTVGLMGFGAIFLFLLVGVAAYNKSVLFTVILAIGGLAIGSSLGLVSVIFVVSMAVIGFALAMLRGGQPSSG